jgi:hypothetical protein
MQSLIIYAAKKKKKKKKEKKRKEKGISIISTKKSIVRIQ